MSKIKYCILAAIVMVLSCPITIHAAEEVTSVVYVKSDVDLLSNPKQQIWDYSFTYTGEYEVLGYLYNNDYVCFICIGKDNFRIPTSGTRTLVNTDDTVTEVKMGDINIQEFTLERVLQGNIEGQGFISSHYVNVQDDKWSVSGAKIFSSIDTLGNYLRSGDTSGCINKFDNYGNEHDFTADLIDASIPVPVLSNVSHNGFTVDNIGEYYVDVIMYNRLYGVKFALQGQSSTTIGDYTFPTGGGMGTSADMWMLVPDNSWVYKENYYNIADHTDFAINKSKINIYEDYGVNVEQDLVTAFEEWSVEYPATKHLPSYKWTLMGHDKEYLAYHVIDATSDVPLLTQVKKSGQAATTYYVRFYAADGSTGQWCSYTYQDGHATINNGVNSDGKIVSGTVELDSLGQIHIKDEIEGSVDTDGNIIYGAVDEFAGLNMDASLNSFKSTLDSFFGALGAIPSYISTCFSFLPWWCTALMGLGIGAIVILRFMGR